MSRLTGKTLNGRVLRKLRGNPSRSGNVILLATSDKEGWPHIAMLSNWEVFAKDKTNIQIATYDSSTTTANLLRNGRVTMTLIDSGMTYYVKGKATLLKRHAESDAYNSIFGIRVRKVLEDKLTGTRITSGITFRKEKGVEPHEELHEELTRC